MKKYIFTILLLSFKICFAQQKIDSNFKASNTFTKEKETVENKCKNHFWGNSSYLSLARNASKNKEYSLSIGRTFGKKNEYGNQENIPEGNYSLFSWGVGVGLVRKQFETDKTFHTFYEYNYIPSILIANFGVRGEYIYNFSNKQQYFRPSFGMALFYIDLHYNYSFLLNGTKSENIYRHGFSIRVKYFTNKKKMEKHIF